MIHARLFFDSNCFGTAQLNPSARHHGCCDYLRRLIFRTFRKDSTGIIMITRHTVIQSCGGGVVYLENSVDDSNVACLHGSAEESIHGSPWFLVRVPAVIINLTGSRTTGTGPAHMPYGRLQAKRFHWSYLLPSCQEYKTTMRVIPRRVVVLEVVSL